MTSVQFGQKFFLCQLRGCHGNVSRLQRGPGAAAQPVGPASGNERAEPHAASGQAAGKPLQPGDPGGLQTRQEHPDQCLAGRSLSSPPPSFPSLRWLPSWAMARASTSRCIFRTARSARFTQEELADYITEKGNPRNQKGVREVEIAYPSEYLRDGVRIIDTPGVGSVYSHNTEVAYNYLPQVDAAVFVVTADPPLSAAEQEFLKDIREYVHKLFFVLNKIDYVDEAERQEALDFTTRGAEREPGRPTGDDLSVVRQAGPGRQNQRAFKLLDASLLPRFEEHLRRFLYADKGRVLLISCINGALKALTDSTLALKVERQARAIPLQELEERWPDSTWNLRTGERAGDVPVAAGRPDQGAAGSSTPTWSPFKRETGPACAGKWSRVSAKKPAGPDLRREMEEFLFAALKRLLHGVAAPGNRQTLQPAGGYPPGVCRPDQRHPGAFDAVDGPDF